MLHQCYTAQYRFTRCIFFKFDHLIVGLCHIDHSRKFLRKFKIVSYVIEIHQDFRNNIWKSTWCCVVRRLQWRCLISRLVMVFVWFTLKDQLQLIKNSINDLDINVADPKTSVFWWFRFYHIICRYFVVLCY
jgi:hypothetical protein